MNEDFLQYVWQFQLFKKSFLIGVNGERITVINPGLKNTDAGPDFFNAKIKIDDKIWCGNIEIHINTSDWNLHKHSENAAFDSLILHIVYNNDCEIQKLKQKNVCTLEIKDLIKEQCIINYNKIKFHQFEFIPCENLISKSLISKKEIITEQLFIENIQKKTVRIHESFQSINSWEALLFQKLAYAFGLKINADAMVFWAKSFPFKLVQKYALNPIQLQALMFGQAGMLENNFISDYPKQLQKEYDFLRKKHQLESVKSSIFKFFRLRPSSFPTLGIAYIAALYSANQSFFMQIINERDLATIKKTFQKCKIHSFWDNHYTFSKESNHKTVKTIGKQRINLILLNAILPIKIAYLQYNGKYELDWVIDSYRKINTEQNTIVQSFKELGFSIKNALQSQAMIHLKTEYCNQKKCLNCKFGNQLISNV